MLSDTEREKLRNSFKPSVIKFLYIGESPPAGGNFFYATDSILFKAIQESFQKHFPNCGNGISFLNYFKKNNFYLDDLCHYPINNLEGNVRFAERLKGVKSLSERLSQFNPTVIISVMKAINSEIEEAISLSGIKIKSFEKLPFPSRPNHKQIFISDNKTILEKFSKG